MVGTAKGTALAVRQNQRMTQSSPTQTETFAAVLFDFDGVLVDSTNAVDTAWEHWSRRRGVDLAELKSFYHGRRTEEVVEAMAPALDPAEEAAWVEDEILGVDGGGIPIEGSRRLYDQIAAGRRGVVTSGLRKTTEARLAALALDPPAALVTADDVARGKPNPDCYLLGARGLGIAPERCLVVEDAPAGIEAGLAAGMTVVAVTTTHDRAELTAAAAVVEPEGLSEAVLPLLEPDARGPLSPASAG